MAKVFISYRREKSDKVDQLVDDISALGHEPWIDRHHEGNQEWWYKILSSIAESDVFVSVYDQEYDNSYPCCRELDYAVDLGLQVIPVFVDGEIPQGFTPRHSHAFNYVEFSNDKASYVRLQNRLNDISTDSRENTNGKIPPGFPANELREVFEEHIVSRADQTERDQIYSLSQIENLIRNDHPSNEILFLLDEHKRRGPQQSYRETNLHLKYEELKKRLGNNLEEIQTNPANDPTAGKEKLISKNEQATPAATEWKNTSGQNINPQDQFDTKKPKGSKVSLLSVLIGITIGALVVGVWTNSKVSDYAAQLVEALGDGKASSGEKTSEYSKIAPGLEMVPIQNGTYMMGSSKQEVGRDVDEGPQHEVAIQAFELSNAEVTFEQYIIFVGETKRDPPDDEGWEQGDRPVINVSWDDAQAYIMWLNEKTLSNFRLPTEAEWEYAVRAGTTTPFYTGDCISTKQVNYHGTHDYNNCGANTGEYLGQTSAVKSYEPNDWGLYDMAGNVWEWTQDCWHEDYTNAPSDGSAWLEDNSGNCDRRVLRGGSWYIGPQFLRSAIRSGVNRDFADDEVGFRLARTP